MLNKFINSIKTYDDFVQAYIVKDYDIPEIWIIIKESNFENNVKYLKFTREFKFNNNCENLFDVMIFDEEQLEEIKEELSYMDYYELVE